MRGSATPILKHNIAKYCIISELNINTPHRWKTQADKTGVCRKHLDKWGNTRTSKHKLVKKKDRAYTYSLGSVLVELSDNFFYE